MQILLTSEITEPYSTTSVISGLFYTHAKYDKKIIRSRRGIWADIRRYAYREILSLLKSSSIIRQLSSTWASFSGGPSFFCRPL